MTFLAQTLLQLEHHFKPWGHLYPGEDSALALDWAHPWGSAQVNLSDLLNPGNDLDFSWCFPLCTCLQLLPIRL